MGRIEKQKRELIEESNKRMLGEQEDSNKEVVNITEKQMDMLHEKGICECGDKCLVYKEVLGKIPETKEDCISISKKQMDMLHKEGKCDCGDVTLIYKKGK